MVIFETQILNVKFYEGDSFYVERHLGGGGFGEVYKVRAVESGKHFALKHIDARKHKLSAPDKIIKFGIELAKEANVNVNSPYVVKSYGLSYLGDTDFCILFEFVEGKTLTEWIEQNTDADFERKKTLFEKILHGVKAAHEQGLTHNDLKPDNIIVSADENPKILDFGLAKSASVNMS